MTDLIQSRLEAGNIVGAIQALAKEIKKQHKEAFESQNTGETKSVLVGTKTETDGNGVEYEKEIFEDQLISPYVELTEDEINTQIDEYLETNKFYKYLIKQQKLKQLEKTEISNGLIFYTDSESIGDIRDAIDEGNELNLLDTHEVEWKTADGIKWVTFADLKEARKTRLENKAKLVGVE